MNKLILFLWLFFFSTSVIFAQPEYKTKYYGDVNSVGYKNFDMNESGSIVFAATDSMQMHQIFLGQNGNLTRITSTNTASVMISGPVHINNSGEIIWLQTEFDEKTNSSQTFVMLYDKNRIIRKVSSKVSEGTNYCVYPTLNNKGEISWIQWAEGNPDTYIYLYSGGKTNTIYEGPKGIGFSYLNNNGFIVYVSQNTPEGDFSYQTFVWDGKTHTKISALQYGESSYFPIIDDNNNIYYQISANGQSYLIHYSYIEKKYSQIDTAIIAGDYLGGHNSVASVDNGRIIFTGINSQIFLYEKGSLTKLTKDNINSSPFIKGDWMGWICSDSKGKVQIEVRHKDNRYYIDSIKSYCGLKISNNGTKVLFASLGISTFSLYLAESVSTGISSKADMNGVAIFPNPATDFLEIRKLDTDFDNQGKTLMYIFDFHGKCILIEQPSRSSIQRIDISSLAKGVYFFIYGKNRLRFLVSR